MMTFLVFSVLFLSGAVAGFTLGYGIRDLMANIPAAEPFQRRRGDVGPLAPVLTGDEAAAFADNAARNMRRRVPDSDYDRAVSAYHDVSLEELGI